MKELQNFSVLVLATNGFAELFEPRQALIDAGATVRLAAPTLAPIKGVSGTDLAQMTAVSFVPDMLIESVDPDEFDALFIPGGLGNPDALRIVPAAVNLVRVFVDSGKVVASICHGPWMLIEAGVVKGRCLTGWRSIRTDLTNAGATVLDQSVVRDGNLLTSRMPADIPTFSNALVLAIKEHSASDFDRSGDRSGGLERS